MMTLEDVKVIDSERELTRVPVVSKLTALGSWTVKMARVILPTSDHKNDEEVDVEVEVEKEFCFDSRDHQCSTM